VKGRQPGTKDNAIYSYAVSMVEETRSKPALCNAAEGQEPAEIVSNVPPPENRKCVPQKRGNRKK
jgi:hypothetical protein